MRLLMVIIAALALGCGTVQPSVGPEQETLVDEFPSKPHPYQRRPGKDGRCSTRRRRARRTRTAPRGRGHPGGHRGGAL
jgi:hypothetical protein